MSSTIASAMLAECLYQPRLARCTFAHDRAQAQAAPIHFRCIAPRRWRARANHHRNFTTVSRIILAPKCCLQMAEGAQTGGRQRAGEACSFLVCMRFSPLPLCLSIFNLYTEVALLDLDLVRSVDDLIAFSAAHVSDEAGRCYTISISYLSHF